VSQQTKVSGEKSARDEDSRSARSGGRNSRRVFVRLGNRADRGCYRETETSCVTCLARAPCMQIGVVIWLPGSGVQLTYNSGWFGILLVWVLWYIGFAQTPSVPTRVREFVDYWWQVHLWHMGQ
jgi:hypothetical protein